MWILEHKQTKQITISRRKRLAPSDGTRCAEKQTLMTKLVPFVFHAFCKTPLWGYGLMEWESMSFLVDSARRSGHKSQGHEINTRFTFGVSTSICMQIAERSSGLVWSTSSELSSSEMFPTKDSGARALLSSSQRRVPFGGPHSYTTLALSSSPEEAVCLNGSVLSLVSVERMEQEANLHADLLF